MTVLNNTPCTRLYLLFSSGGGNIEDGFALFNLMRSLNMPITIVNMGQVGSIATLVFLGGSHRIARPDSYFYFHEPDWTITAAQVLSATQTKNIDVLLTTGRLNMRDAFKAHTKLTDADLDSIKFMEEPYVMDASAAKAKDIVHDVVDFKVPAGVSILNVDY